MWTRHLEGVSKYGPRASRRKIDIVVRSGLPWPRDAQIIPLQANCGQGGPYAGGGRELSPPVEEDRRSHGSLGRAPCLQGCEPLARAARRVRGLDQAPDGNEGSGVTTSFRASFAGHETFPFRYTWLKKGVDSVAKDPDVFGKEDAMVTFGVGKNMVASIRHWGLSIGTLEEDPGVQNNRGRRLRVSDLGASLCLDSGWDPYLEDVGTLWLIHWRLASTPEPATTWWWVFNQYPGTRFTRRELQAQLERLVEQLELARVSPASLKRDIDCFIRTYSPSRRARTVQEETLDCPLIELGLLREDNDHQSHQIVHGMQPTLPPAIFAYALAEYLERRAAQAPTVSLSELAYGAGAPGRVFCLNESGLLAHLETIGALTGGALVYDETAGLKQVFLHKVIRPKALLEHHYGSRKAAAWDGMPHRPKR